MPRGAQHAGRRPASGHPLLEAMNDATKWAVSAAAFGTLLWRRDLLASWCVLGSIVAAINCKVRWARAGAAHLQGAGGRG